jgi:hypothetical protein
MSEQLEQTAENPKIETVLARTLGIRPLIVPTSVDGTTVEVSGVYGGVDGKVWVASFFDHQEAQAWIMASNQFGQPVRGLRTEIIDGPRVQS